MDSLSPSAANALRTDCLLVDEAVQSGVVSARTRTARNHWSIWVTYCHTYHLDPLLPNCTDPIPYLQVFAQQWRSGKLAPCGNPVRRGSVDEALRSVGQTFASLGAHDIRFNSFGKIDFRLARQLAFYSRSDDAPIRVKPLPITVVQELLSHAYAAVPPNPTLQATADMCCIAYFFLCRPGEYTTTTDESTPFRLCDTQFFVGSDAIDLSTSTDAACLLATGCSLTYTNQKNGVRGEVIAHGVSGDPLCCATRALIRRCRHLLSYNAPPDTPLNMVFRPPYPSPFPVQSCNITQALRLVVGRLGPRLGILPGDISSRSLRAGGAQALLCAGVDYAKIQLIGRWKSDTALQYLHAAALPAMKDYATRMVAGGSFSVIPNQFIYMD